MASVVGMATPLSSALRTHYTQCRPFNPDRAPSVDSASQMVSVGLSPSVACRQTRPVTRLPSLHLLRSQLPGRSVTFPSQAYNRGRRLAVWKLCASEVDAEVEAVEEADLDPSFVPVFSVEDLPKGERREVLVDGKQIVVFWYRNELFACEARSPAEGAFSTGFLTADFRENYGIVCPGTDTVFSLKTGEIMEWYPTNFVLRTLIPKDTCRNLEVYPVKMTKDTIYISFKSGNLGGMQSMRSKGGANTSLEDNNVFGLEPRVYVEDSGQETVAVDKTTSTSNMEELNPVTILVATLAVAIVAVSGTAVAVYYESIVGGIVFWIVLFGAVAYAISQVTGIFEDKSSS